jgi:sugar phosphate isomerase/epimerase
MGAFKLPDYRRGWHQRQIRFWKSLAREAEESGLCILLENMWADDPDVLVDILQEIDSPNFRACLDMSHVSLYSKQSLDTWIDELTPWLQCCHLNNTDGKQDLHWSLKQGIIDYESVLTKMRRLPVAPFMTLEMPDWQAIEQSLPFFELSGEL